MANRLERALSPYLLQHANNPVDWFPWGDEAWQKARKENKLVLVSIGYSACHWCHVMEREVFEKVKAAEVMNTHFVSIKVDREERPDVDQVYMTALQLMTGQGGWPLNVFCLPDGRPVYGGTYFPLDRWLGVLDNLLDILKNEPDKLVDYAARLKEGVEQSGMLVKDGGDRFDTDFLNQVVDHWKSYWDPVHGGARKAPKFPMPSNLEFLLDYGILEKDETALSFVRLTLEKMAMGGIYDQIGGGFARYSVDAEWKVPHFEKMLYDNAQLISIYSKSFRAERDPLWEDVIRQTIAFHERKLSTADGLFYAALDADSEGEEGRYYTWEKKELQELLGSDYPLAADYFRVGEEGAWEHGRNIFLRTQRDEEFARRHRLQPAQWREKREQIQTVLLNARRKRVLPGLDFKVLTSWNAMMISSYCEAWKALETPAYLQRAITAGNTLRSNIDRNGGIHRQYTGGYASGTAFLDDYAHVIDAWINLFECTMDPCWLSEAHALCLSVMDHFHDQESPLFWFTPDDAESLYVRQKEVADNVIPSANSVMCNNLFILGRLLGKPHLEAHSEAMLRSVLGSVDYGASWSNWLRALLRHNRPFREVVVCGPAAGERQREWYGNYLPNAVFAASTTDRSLPLFEGRFRDDTPVYVCTGSVCQAPVTDIHAALERAK